MTPDHEKLVESIAWAICAARGLDPDSKADGGFERLESGQCLILSYPMWRAFENDARAALSAIAAAGCAVVPTAATEAMVARVLLIASDPTDADKRVGAGACLLLSGGRRIPNEGDGVIVAAEMARDFRAMVEASPYAIPALASKEGE